ncbi:hypothetical protein [Streptomyces sp. UNOC14_S4]|uniref:hypothetical protein n=1 Tax=Streptomyces sp. UNOC14_S4 TaxID=2872340 RepID=UPI001E440A6D|nr:hypothetical protein [Streptomyces sp. UNOC14_S4]MCC3770072.1 hypothetical protein [Streptomyces sp. UNOC14_S4]
MTDRGMNVFLKADGQRRTPGWTFLVSGGPLSGTLRSDGGRAEKCLGLMLSELRRHGLEVPV